MLVQLEIKNYAIIQHVNLHFDAGLNIITGETGAGKSILIGALGLCLGERADTKVLYNQEDKCIVEATFKVGNNYQGLFENADVDFAEKTTVRREISPNGKTRAFINDTPVTLENLRNITELLVNLSSQHEANKFNQPNYQLELLDVLAQNKETLKQYQQAFSAYKKDKQTLQKIKDETQKLQQEFEFFQFQLNELNEADFEEDDLNLLEEELNTLTNAGEIKQHLFKTSGLLENNDFSVLSMVNEALQSLHAIDKFNEKYKDLAQRLQSALLELEDIKQEAENLGEQTDLDEERIQIVTEKVNTINRLLKKHQVLSLDELKQIKQDLETKTLAVSDNEKAITTLEKSLKEQEEKLTFLASQLSDKRKKAALEARTEIEKTLAKVGMPNAVFDLDVMDLASLSDSGNNQVQFLFNANKGFEPQALNKIASGGELSRVLLSLQPLLAKNTEMPSLIFDEIDTGISGETAAKVAEVFREISQKHQLIAITHLPQIAAKAEKHFFIYKTHDKEKTETKIAALNDEQHVKAIARMLSGEQISEESLHNAKKLISA